MDNLKRMESWAERSRARFAGVMLALVGMAMEPFAVFGQPVDSIVGAFGLVLLVGGIGLAAWGIFTVMTAKGKSRLFGGAAGLVIGLIVVAMFGIPALPSAQINQPPAAGGVWQICVTNAKYASIGLGTCANSMGGLVTETKGQPGAGATGKYVYFNATVTPPSGSNQISYNVVASLGSVPTVTNTSNPTTTGSVLALTSTGAFDVLITPASGTGTSGQQVIPMTSGTAKVVAYQVHLSSTLSELALTQYPITFNVIFTFADQTTGNSLGSITLTMTVN